MRMDRTTLVSAVFLLAAGGLAAGGRAQATDWTLKLSDADEGVVEDACRRLMLAAKTGQDEAKLINLLESEQEVTRWSAARLLLHHGLGRDALSAILMEAPELRGDPAAADDLRRGDGVFRSLFVPVATDEELVALVSHKFAEEVRVAALRALEARGLLTDALTLSLLGDSEDAVGDEVARILVHERGPCSVVLARRAEAVDFGVARLCAKLAERPRAEAVLWIGELLKAGDVSLDERMWAFAALGPAGLGVAEARQILDASLDSDLRSAALHAADQLSPNVADKLVPELHKRCLMGKSASEMLDCMDRLSPKGERHLLGLARALPMEPREEIAEWLTRRSSAAVATLVEGALDGSFALEPYLIRRSMPFLKDADHRNTVLAFLQGGDAHEAVAAFAALVDAGIYDERMLEYALDDERQQVSRLRRLLELPFHLLPVSLFVELLEHSNEALVAVALASLRPGPMVHDLEPHLLRLTTDLETSVGLRAAERLFAAGRSQVVEELFAKMIPAQRQRVLSSLRERKEPWVMAMLKRDDSIASQFTRMCLGDQAVFDQLIADPKKWSARWLSRCDDLALEYLSAKHLSGMERALLLQPISSERRSILVGWLAQRPDLACGALLTRLYEKDGDEEVVYEALRGLLSRPLGKVIRDRCQELFVTGMSETDKDLAYEVVGAMTAPLSVDDAEFLAQLMLLVPLTDPVAESSLHLVNSGAVRIPDLPLLNMFWHLIRKGLSADAQARVREVAAAAMVHPNRHALGRRRLGGLLVMISRDASLRASLAPAIAKLIVMSPDHAADYLGPAYFVLGEEAARAEDWKGAAAAYASACRYFMHTPPRPSVVRIMLGENLQGDGQIPVASLTSLPHEYRARAAHAAGNRAKALELMARARSLAFGDRESERVLGTLQQEIER